MKRTGKRSEIFLATKFGFTADPNRLLNGSPEYAREALDRSLKKLGVDYIDLYYLHRVDSAVPIEVSTSRSRINRLTRCWCSIPLPPWRRESSALHRPLVRDFAD